MDLDPPPPYEPPPYEPPSDPGDDASADFSTDISDISDDVSFDDSDPGVNWARNHLLEARAALASYPGAKRALKRQVLEEQEMIRLGIDHHGPPPAHAPRIIVPPWKDGSTLTDVVPTSSIFGPGNIEEELDQAIRFQEFGYMNMMPVPPRRQDPLRDAFGGVQTMAVRNPSIKWGAMVPRQHFPGAEVEGVLPEMQLTPEFVIIKRHVCGTQCPEGCHEGGGVRRKGKGKPVVEVGDVEGGEAMEGVVSAHWGNDDFDESGESGSEHERQEKSRKQQELETIETLEHCTIIERHRRKWAAEIGALTFKARIMSEKLPSISLNTKEPSHESERVYEPAFMLAGKMMNRLDDQRKKEAELKQEKARLARIRIAKFRAARAGRDTSKMGDEAGETMFQSLVDSGNLAAPENNTGNESFNSAYEKSPTGRNDDGAPGLAPRSPDKEDAGERRKQEKSRLAKIRLAEWRAAMAEQNTTRMGGKAGEAALKSIDDSPGPSVVTENAPTSDFDEAMPLQDSYPTVKSTEEAVSDLAEQEDNILQETAQEGVPEEIRKLEATSQETTAEESIAQALIAPAAIVRDATTPDLDLEETPISESAPKESTSVEATPEDATSEKSAAKEAAPEDATAETPAPKEAAPEDLISEKSTPKETAPEDTTSGKSAPKEAALEDATAETPAKKEAAPEDTKSEKSAPKEATREETTTQNAMAEENSAQENLGPGPSRKRPAPNKSSLKRRPAKRQSIRDSPFLDASERESPSTWILQRDGRLIRNPLDGAPGYRRWSDPEIDAPVPMPLSDSEPRPRSTTISEGTEPPVPRCSAEDTLPTVGEEGQMTEHVEVVDDSPDLPTPAEWFLADRESMPPPPSRRLRKRSMAVSEGSQYKGNLWSADDMFPSPERLSRAARRSSSGGDSDANVTSLAPARASTPEPPQMSREQIRNSAHALADLLGPSEERFRDPNIGIIVVRTNPRMADLEMRYRPTRAPSVLRMEILIDEEALEAENAARRGREVEDLERGVFASRVPDPPRYNLRSRSRASSDTPSPATPSIFSGETSGRSTEATSGTATPTLSGDLTSEAVAADEVAEDRSGMRVVERVVDRVLEGVYLPSSPTLAVDRLVMDRSSAPAVSGSEGGPNLWREESSGTEGSMGRERSMGREGSMESLGSTGRTRSIGREGSIAMEVAETLGGLAVESVSEEGEPEEGSGVLGRVLPSTEVPEEAIEDDEAGAPLTKVSSHSSSNSL
ncbi:hypothetical protein VE01_02947 [Pseudogymnoascus verrucosus]|uniref:Uncharacterized protein n=1 Tax=Pseudogymnoascus verrucosus TaxID=342668 RepID=A0A1B8GU93_9PEZI|nr:uncharacterized protein VE01_02947 [Pseudogymnoascus verrucosus]OBT99412.1 hypothetical protein VE01_02947 [Pseudogymnoascus verrucosus]